MKKKRKNMMVSLSDEIVKDILWRRKHEGFRISYWIEGMYKVNFMEKKQLEKEIETMKQRIHMYEERLKEVEKKHEENIRSITPEEREYLRKVPDLLEKGFDIKPIMNRFNYDFKREMNLKDFKQLVHTIELNEV